MDKRITDKLDRLTDIIDFTIDDIFIDAHAEVGTTNGDITPEQVARLDTIKKTLLNLLMQQLEQNLPEIPLEYSQTMIKE